MGAKDNLAVRRSSCALCPAGRAAGCCRAASDKGKGRRRWVLKCGEVLGSSAKSRGSSSISLAFLQTLVVAVLVRPTEGGAPDEPAVEVGERLMLADKRETERERRGSYIFAGRACLRNWTGFGIGGGREPGAR